MPQYRRRQQSAAGWPPAVEDRTVAPPPLAPSRVDRELEHHDKRFGWVWRFVLICSSCIAFGWAGHATIAAWATNWQTTAGAELDRDRIRKLEDNGARGAEQRIHDLERDVEQLKKELAAERADRKVQEDRSKPHRLPGAP